MSHAEEAWICHPNHFSLRCGLCCDGTLFPFVRLKPDDEITPLEAAGINIILDSNSDGLATGRQLAVVEGANVSNSGPIFEQPCAAHKNCACIVYAHRPQHCRTYRCEMLKRFERGDISHEIALEIINKTISLKNEVKALVLAVSTDIHSAEEVTLQVKRWLVDPTNRKAKHGYAHLFRKFLTLQIYLDKFFRKNSIIQRTARMNESGTRVDRPAA
jgi:hypothetical protein